ncbi:MAG: hypothetical protein J7545_08940 [Roseofilum sp. SBFL]|uniref:WD40 repeat domain-containing protein n=1 Tax=unclassified Roseofilum TaxID=2620099 RepID=UPI001B0847E3|nr:MULTISPECIES: hypothetical protein [unclassified Roseofilum]MBP0014941.1 hypothetical protein [Roseofilum sp. SID3]MBP0025763.1 hypothetical protein [Roseofilum sp. SID2]MBP0037076.1 hypothetical protein [Roseofilum sp. SID1]MBP0042083.1 hypothetical protein [Roseofilum sp. SBFL]
MSNNKPTVENRHWTEIAESVSIVASVVGAGFAMLLEKVVFVATPMSLSLFLNLINRQRLAAQYQQDRQTDLPQLQATLSEEIESLRAVVLSLGSEINPRQWEQGLSRVETNLMNRLSVLETLDFKSMEEELAQLRNQSNYVLESLAQILQRIDRLPTEERLQSLESQLTEISSEVKTFKQDVDSDLAELRGQYSRLQEHLDQSFSEFQDSLSTWKEALQTQIDRLDLSQLNTASSQLQSLETTLERLGCQSTELLNSIVHVNEQLQSLPVPQTPGDILPQLSQLQTQLNQVAAEIGRLPSQTPAPATDSEAALSQLQSQLKQQTQLLLQLQSRLERSPEPPTTETEPPVGEVKSFTERAEKWVSRIKQGFDDFQSQMDFEPDLSRDDEWGEDDEWETPEPVQPATPQAPSPVVSPPESVKSKTGWQCVKTLTQSSALTCLALSSDGSRLVSGGYQEMNGVDLSTYEVTRLSLDTEDLSVSSVALSRDGKTLAAATGEIEIWNLTTGKLLQQLECEDWTTVVAISADGQTLVSAGSEPLEEKSSLRFWDFAHGELIRTNYYVDYEIDSLGFSRDGDVLAIAGRNDHRGLIQVWQVGADTPQMTLEVTMALYSVALTPDAQMLAGGCGDRTIKLWNCSTRGLVRTFSGHQGIVYAVGLNPDGQVLVSGSHDQTIKLWELETGEQIDTLVGHQGPVTAVAFSPDGKTLISGSQDMSVKIWQQTG